MAEVTRLEREPSPGVSIIVGASSSMGHEVAKYAAIHGETLLLTCREHSAPKLFELAQDIHELGAMARVCISDVTEPKAAVEVFKEAEGIAAAQGREINNIFWLAGDYSDAYQAFKVSNYAAQPFMDRLFWTAKQKRYFVNRKNFVYPTPLAAHLLAYTDYNDAPAVVWTSDLYDDYLKDYELPFGVSAPTLKRAMTAKYAGERMLRDSMRGRVKGPNDEEGVNGGIKIVVAGLALGSHGASLLPAKPGFETYGEMRELENLSQTGQATPSVSHMAAAMVGAALGTHQRLEGAETIYINPILLHGEAVEEERLPAGGVNKDRLAMVTVDELEVLMQAYRAKASSLLAPKELIAA